MNLESFNKNHWCPKCQAHNFEPSQSIVTVAGDDHITHVSCLGCGAEYHIVPTSHYSLLASKRVEVFWTLLVWAALWLFVDYMTIEIIYPVLLLMGYVTFGWTIPFPTILNPPKFTLRPAQ